LPLCPKCQTELIHVFGTVYRCGNKACKWSGILKTESSNPIVITEKPRPKRISSSPSPSSSPNEKEKLTKPWREGYFTTYVTGGKFVHVPSDKDMERLYLQTCGEFKANEFDLCVKGNPKRYLSPEEITQRFIKGVKERARRT